MTIRCFVFSVVCALQAVAWPAAAQTAPHPLVGRILNTRTGALTTLSDSTVVRSMFPCSAITLLGELHDNADHHKMRAELIRATVAAGRDQPANCGRGALVFEHVNADQQSGLESFREFDLKARRPATAADFFRLLKWGASGWPDKSLFAPLLREAIRSKRQMYAGSPSGAWVKRIAKEGVSIIPPDRARALGLDRPLSDQLTDALLTELEASHCGLVPKSAFGNMATAQRYRDAYLAEATLKAAQAQGSAIVLAGNGHVRVDRGIPAELQRLAPDRTVIAVAFVETEDGKTDPAAYGPRDPKGRPAADYIAFAAPALRNDPCLAMRKAMKP